MMKVGLKTAVRNLKSIKDNVDPLQILEGAFNPRENAMKVMYIHTIAAVLAIVCGNLTFLDAAPRRGYYDQDQSVALNETRDTLDTLRHQVDNQESEIRSFEQKLDSLNTILESIRDEIETKEHAQKEQLKGNSNALEVKIASLENTAKSLSADMKQLQSHANETASALTLFKQKMAEWDQRLQAQNQNIENLQAALQTVMDAFQAKADLGSISGWTGRTYKVKGGDSLEKIARAHQTTITAIKELNNMNSDKIVVGKTLKIPN